MMSTKCQYSPEISIGPVAVQKYSAFLRELAVPTNFNIVAVRPLRGNGLIVCEPTLVFGIIDTLYGGAGKYHTRIEGRDFSLTEQRVINRLVDVIRTEYIHLHAADTALSPSGNIGLALSDLVYRIVFETLRTFRQFFVDTSKIPGEQVTVAIYDRRGL